MKVPTLTAGSACACAPGRCGMPSRLCRDWTKRAGIGPRTKREAKKPEPVDSEPATAPEIEHLAEQLAREEAPDNE